MAALCLAGLVQRLAGQWVRPGPGLAGQQLAQAPGELCLLLQVQAEAVLLSLGQAGQLALAHGRHLQVGPAGQQAACQAAERPSRELAALGQLAWAWAGRWARLGRVSLALGLQALVQALVLARWAARLRSPAAAARWVLLAQGQALGALLGHHLEVRAAPWGQGQTAAAASALQRALALGQAQECLGRWDPWGPWALAALAQQVLQEGQAALPLGLPGLQQGPEG